MAAAANIAIIIFEIVGIHKRKGGFRKMLLSGNGLFHHTLNPIISSVYITRAGSRLISGQLFCLGQYLHLR